jgi:dihydroneopterin aldolase
MSQLDAVASLDRVMVSDLRFKTIVGCWDWERQLPQEVSIDLEMAWDMSRAAATEKLEHALNYKAVAKRVQAFVQDAQFELVETAAHAIADLVISEFAVPWIRVTFTKPYAVTGSRAVGVRVEKRAPEPHDD